MEPDIVRMYSSSPPPLDNGPDEEEEEEEEEEEFGDFGGFSDIGSTSVSFDFASEYSSSKEEHKSSFNSDYSGKVDSIITFTAIRYTNNKDSITELPCSIEELPINSKEKCECRSLGTSIDDVIPVEGKRTGMLESSYSEIIRTDLQVPSQDQQMDNCNGERLLCPEILTNGFSELDMASSQGAVDLDSASDSKRLQIISTHNTELNLDSLHSTEENFATFSHKQTIPVERTKGKIGKVLNEKEVLNAQENNVNSIGEAESMKETTSDKHCECERKTFPEDEQICISKTNLIANNLKGVEDYTESEFKDIAPSIQINVNSLGTNETMEDKGDGTRNSKQHVFSWTTDASVLNLSRLECFDSLPSDKKVNVSEVIKNHEGSTGHASSGNFSEDDFSIVSNRSLAFADSVHVSASQEHFQSPFENISKPSNECNKHTTSSLHQQSTEVTHGQPIEISGAVLEECQVPASGVSEKIQSTTEFEHGDDNEFGDFDSVSKRFPDIDEFSDFSSAGCNQISEWNAFETEQKERCLWATFEEQLVKSHPGEHERPFHTTDPIYNAEDSVNQTMNNVISGSEQLQELPSSTQEKLLNRLEQVFQACFAPVLVSEMKEEITPLNLLLEVGKQSPRTVENVSERELFDVWAELQDIHDAFGLRYQWGGSHSNKKLLCSLGIDTRNILFTGNKKQPVIVPMYAAGLGMLEPTKEPLKPISAAEKIASIGQSPAISPEINICPSDQFQESLPPVQFDWSSSGLTNPLDASGGSTLLNLDFFGPVDDSSSITTTTIPGVDPELYELTTSKLENSNITSKVTDAFAKLMSSAEKTSMSARKPPKEEELSEEAAKVIASLPDLSFMHAKVLMFPATLTPSTSCQGKVD